MSRQPFLVFAGSDDFAHVDLAQPEPIGRVPRQRTNIPTIFQTRAFMDFTPYDVRLGEVYYRQLLNLARTRPGETMRYGEVVERAQRDFPADEVVRSAIPLSIGRRLATIESFCASHQLPNLACLLVNSSGQPGSSYKGDWEAEKQRVAEFDWESCEQEWAVQLEQWRIAAKKKLSRLEKRSCEAAEREFMRHWRADRDSGEPLYPTRLDNDVKEQIIKALMKGHDAEYAFQAALADAWRNGPDGRNPSA